MQKNVNLQFCMQNFFSFVQSWLPVLSEGFFFSAEGTENCPSTNLDSAAKLRGVA